MNTADIPPNQTLYVSNLYEKLKQEELKKILYACFSPHGKIIDVVAVKSFRLRGQAWIVFDDISAATDALRSLQGFPLLDKPMRIQYARGKSDAVAKVAPVCCSPIRNRFTQADGTYRPRDLKASKAHNEAAKEALQKRGAERRMGAPPTTVVPQAPIGGFVAADGKGTTIVSSNNIQANKILFIQNLPEGTDANMVTMLFQQFPGFKEVCVFLLLDSIYALLHHLNNRRVWLPRAPGLRLSSLATRQRRAWRSTTCRTSRSRRPTPCTFPMQSSNLLHAAAVALHTALA